MMHEDLQLRFTGIAPLLMRSGRLADPLDEHSIALARVTSKRAKTPSDHGLIAQIEWRGSLWLKAGMPCVPAEAIESALTTAAKSRRAGTLVRAAVIVHDSPALQYDGPQDIGDLFSTPGFVHRCGVRIGTRRTMRTRPQFPSWRLDVTLSYMPSMIDGATLIEIATIAGHIVGLGDFRPRFGRFRVDPVG